MAWIKAASLDALREKPLVFKHPPRQIALFRVDGRVFAIDNRCPHEGYPLALGSVSADCVLTCNWHNWKFKLEDGTCVMGGDNVRSYPTRLQHGPQGDEVWVDIVAPPLEETRREILGGLRKAFSERDYGRMCREIARLHFNGLDPKDAIREGIAWSYDRLEWGTWDSHAYAAAADWLALAETFGDDFERRLVCFAEPLDHMAVDSLRRPEYPYAAPGEPFEASRFLSAVEAEQSSAAEGMVARALADGQHWADLEETFVAAAFAHYNDFGHCVIYIPKTAELLARLGEGVERYVLLAFARQLCYANREDLIPDFKDYAAALRSLPEPRQESAAKSSLEVPYALSLEKSFEWLAAGLQTHSVTAVYDALLTALAQNMLHYDTSFGTSFDRSVHDNTSWLAFTHGITFANASRVICAKYPQFWRVALLQMACFLGRNLHYLDKKLDADAWKVSDTGVFFAQAHERLLDHGINEPIFAVHLLKTTLAVETELPFASPVCRDALLASLNRFLHASLKLKHSRRLARQAIALVSRDF
jgi:nitrite reductase/ring-hydroxylating ferredoxin subunit